MFGKYAQTRCIQDFRDIKHVFNDVITTHAQYTSYKKSTEAIVTEFCGFLSDKYTTIESHSPRGMGKYSIFPHIGSCAYTHKNVE